MKSKHLNSLYSLVKAPELFGRYITNSDIEKCLVKFPKSIISTVGYSVENRPIYSIKLGTGSKNVLLWSQMHGNESTTTKALFDCFNLFLTNNNISNFILKSCTILVIPILNPDGAERYTRLNANDIDLNRDAQALSQPESKVLRAVFDDFKPDYCFNLHGQRTIYNVGTSSVSATLSFLSPAQDQNCSLTVNRKVAMRIISRINDMLQTEMPDGVARYDDSFNLNCVGDTFQSLGVPTLLYEAGHLPNDYQREEVRRLVFLAAFKGLYIIAEGVDTSDYDNYFDIPENNKQFYDIIIRNARLNIESPNLTDVAILYKEALIGCKIEFLPIVEAIKKLDYYFGHREIDAKGNLLITSEKSALKVTNEIDFVMINNEKISLKPLNN
ncbi:M14 metallopeptidase family protein [uncultured Winogradskyella sp.]|uniref:M14 family metallopeptidase n=1 Tax=uncultured Winogradskyella sp. TaxID=395353 RepID=UPI0026397797|nr:M14 metallopeptidase family protein [uncultured Winogradskyella sp.]